MYILIYITKYANIRIYVYLYLYTYWYPNFKTSVNCLERFERDSDIYMYMYVCMYLYIYSCIIPYIYMYVYVYIYIYIYMYLCICIHMYTSIQAWKYSWKPMGGLQFLWGLICELPFHSTCHLNQTRAILLNLYRTLLVHFLY
jgi:hypothetical protein